jgi:hypothetical protein
MATALRRTVQDFIAAIAARGVNAGDSKNLYSASLNSDNTTISVTRNGAVIFPKILWNQGYPEAITDSGGTNSDSITNYFTDGSIAVGSAQDFLNTLR